MFGSSGEKDAVESFGGYQWMKCVDKNLSSIRNPSTTNGCVMDRAKIAVLQTNYAARVQRKLEAASTVTSDQEE